MSVFQTVFDLASTISINKRGVVAQTTSRNQTTRAVSRGGQVWRFDVKLPDGLPWDLTRGVIEGFDKADRFTVDSVQINRASYNNWLTTYNGNCTGMSGAWTVGDQLTIAGGTGTVAFKAGDHLQLGSGHVYSVVNDLNSGTGVVTLNRPIIEPAGSASLITGPNVTWSVMCTAIPTWTIFQRNQVSWSGAFSFIEVLV